MLKYLFIYSTVLIPLTFSFAQTGSSIQVLSKSKKDGIYLRWAPTNIASWEIANRVGYVIERFTLLPDGNLETNSQRLLTPIPIKPFSKDQFTKINDPSDEVSAVEELLYNKPSNTNSSVDNIRSVITKRNELENRFGMILLMSDFSIEAAKAAGLFFFDGTVKVGSRYIYRIKLADSQQTFQVTAGVTNVTFNDEKPLLAITDLAVTFTDRKATLSWSTLFHRGIYSAYYLEKSEDGKNYKKISPLPYVHMSTKAENETAYFIDSLSANGKRFYYRINGVSPFAEKGPYSNIAHGEGKDNLTGLLILREGKVVEKNIINLTWEFPTNAEKQIAGFIISSCNNPNGPFTDLTKKTISRSLREYVTQTSYNNTYFTIRAVSKSGEEITRSFQYLVQVPDETIPLNPTGLMGTMSQTGVASLSWNSNSDNDLLGYRVYRSNSPDEEFVEVTKEILKKSTFTDSINIRVLNKSIYYYVVAMDKNYNPSNYSNLLKLKRPDIIPPATPVFKRIEMVSDSICLDWENSISDDVSTYELIRIEKEAHLSRVIKTWNYSNLITHYTDRGLILGNNYSYQLVVYDSANNKNADFSKNIHFETGVRNAVNNIQSNVDRLTKTIHLQWNSNQPSTRCFIYKQKNNGAMTLFKTFDGNTKSFTDKDITINNEYTYRIQLVFAKGIKSLLSEPVNISY